MRKTRSCSYDSDRILRFFIGEKKESVWSFFGLKKIF